MSIYTVIILIGIVVALIINFVINKPDASLEQNTILTEPAPELTITPEPTPDPEPYPKVDSPLPTGEAKVTKKGNTKKPKTNK